MAAGVRFIHCPSSAAVTGPCSETAVRTRSRVEVAGAVAFEAACCVLTFVGVFMVDLLRVNGSHLN